MIKIYNELKKLLSKYSFEKNNEVCRLKLIHFIEQYLKSKNVHNYNVICSLVNNDHNDVKKNYIIVDVQTIQNITFTSMKFIVKNNRIKKIKRILNLE